MRRLSKGISDGLLILGDSIALGAAEISEGVVRQWVEKPWVTLLEAAEVSFDISVDAAVGRTTSDAIAVLSGLLRERHYRSVLLFVGGNDIDLNWRRFLVSGGRRVFHRVDSDRYEANLRQMVSEIREAGSEAILTDTPGLDFLKHARWLSSELGRDVTPMVEVAGGQEEVRRRVASYNARLEHVVEETGVSLVQWSRAVSEQLPWECRTGPDGVHPGNGAHRVIAESIASVLRQRRISQHSAVESAA